MEIILLTRLPICLEDKAASRMRHGLDFIRLKYPTLLSI